MRDGSVACDQEDQAVLGENEEMRDQTHLEHTNRPRYMSVI